MEVAFFDVVYFFCIGKLFITSYDIGTCCIIGGHLGFFSLKLHVIWKLEVITVLYTRFIGIENLYLATRNNFL